MDNSRISNLVSPIILRGGFLLIHSGGLFIRELNDYCDTMILAVFPLPNFLTYLTGSLVYPGTLWGKSLVLKKKGYQHKG